MSENCILEILKIEYDEETRKGFVEAILEDFACIRYATYFDPPEYGNALCRADFQLDEDEELPTENVESFFENRYLIWEEVMDDF